MQDVSVLVGGTVGSTGTGPINSFSKGSGDIQTSEASLVMVENFSPFVFQIGNEAIPPMYRRTFSIDNYPQLHWTIGSAFGAIGGNLCYPQRLVRILLDPAHKVDDGPVYPEPIPVSGILPGDGSNIFSALAKLKESNYVDSAAVKDVGFVGFQIEGSGFSQYIRNLFMGSPVFGDDVITVVHQSIYQQNASYIGKDWSRYFDIPGHHQIEIDFPGAMGSTGSIAWTGWVGYHL